MNFIILMALTVIIQESRSQTLTTDLDCFENGVRLVIMCVTPDFTQGINFNLNGVNQGGCVPLLTCSSETTQSVDTTSFTIASFNDSTNSGNWTCTYGVSTSKAVVIAANPCNASSEKSRDDLTWVYIGASATIITLSLLILLIIYLVRRIKSGRKRKDRFDLSRKRKDRFDLNETYEKPSRTLTKVEIYEKPSRTLTKDQTNDENTEIVTEVTNKKGTKKITDETNVNETVSAIGETIHKETGTVTEPKRLSVLAHNRPKGFGICFIPQIWMLSINTVDSELPRAFKWINDDGDNFVVTKNNYHNLFKHLLENLPDPNDNGIYQCVRTLENGKEDKINVVLHVTDDLPCTLMVHPNFWKGVSFQDKEPEALKTLIASKTEIEENTKNYEVEWKFRSGRFAKFESFGKNSKSTKKKGKTSLTLKSRRVKPNREYRCTVTLESGLKQIYFFFVKVLDENSSNIKGGHSIAGVPNILEEKGEFFYYFAYGSNLLTERLHKNNKTAVFVEKAELKGYTLDFISLKDPANSTWKGGVANIIPSKHDSVMGVIWKLNVENIPSLDGQEATYEAIYVKPIFGTNKQVCRTYLIDPTKASKEFKQIPSPQYLHIIALGAQKQRLPSDYLKKLKAIRHNENKEPVPTYSDLIKELRIENITTHSFDSKKNYFNLDTEEEEL